MDHRVECVFTMVILPDFRIGQNRDDDHQEDTSHFMISCKDDVAVSV